MIVKKYDVNNFNELEVIWRKLEKGEDMTVYQTYEWSNLLNKQYIKFGRLYRLICKYEYYVFYENNDPKVIVPLMIQKVNLFYRNHGIKKGVYIIGTKNYSDYLNWIYSELSEEYFNFIFDWLIYNFTKFDISFLYIKEKTKLSEYLILKKGIKKMEDTICVYVKNEYDAERYKKMISKKNRQKLRASIKKIKEKNIPYEIKEYSIINDDKLINSLVNLHIKRYIQKNGKNGIVTNCIKWIIQIIIEKWNNIIAESMRNSENSWLLVIYINNKIAGFLYGLKWKNEIDIMQVCLNTEYKRFNPVIRGMYDYIIKENVSGCKIKKFDFTCGNERYKYDLNGKNSILNNFLIEKNKYVSQEC